MLGASPTASAAEIEDKYIDDGTVHRHGNPIFLKVHCSFRFSIGTPFSVGIVFQRVLSFFPGSVIFEEGGKEGRKAGRQEGRKEGRKQGSQEASEEGRKGRREEGKKGGRSNVSVPGWSLYFVFFAGGRCALPRTPSHFFKVEAGHSKQNQQTSLEATGLQSI